MSQASLTSLFTQTGKGLRASSSFTEPASSSKSGHTRKRSEAEDTFATQVTPLKRQRVTTSARLQSAAPLAERLRPQTLAEFVGQPHLTGPGSLLKSQLDRGATGSIIFWGPPGYGMYSASFIAKCLSVDHRCGKTTIARLLAKSSNAVFKELSATDSGIADVRAVVEEAKSLLALTGRSEPRSPVYGVYSSGFRARRTILFLDEVHRFNKAQQVNLLPKLRDCHH